ncbi:Hint domain-containing protein [Litoreibacter halocynthiae]|uniref:Hint domain-containing protein n=1 Tax=Litoreibacter halocynthiae TaxID=1242689 RepID=A0A4R7LIJ1_9RHOB|nr:Hint domain-containing protein [Litoreibacter halocynthiae]TDT74181.1 Hint domain-containing protein [Litoreibacter halocynthiae]
MAILHKSELIGQNGLFQPSALWHLPVSGFGGGTLIATDEGYVPMDWLRPGDMVLTYNDGFQKVRWIGRDCLVEQPQNSAAVRLPDDEVVEKPNAQGMLLAARHRVLLTGWQVELHFGMATILAEAHDFGFPLDHFRPTAPERMACSLVLLDRPQIILANGCWVESLQLTSAARACLTESATSRIAELGLDPADHIRPAAGCMQPWEARTLGLDLCSLRATDPR